MSVTLLHGDCLEHLARLADNSVDASATDPPAGIGFMGKEWDCFRRAKNTQDSGRPNVFGRTSTSAPGPRAESRAGIQRERENFIGWLTAVARELLRVLKPGAHALVWSLPRTSHWTATALEDAGFEVRDTIAHFFGQGFPKSLDVAKAIQKADGVAPIGEKPASLGMANNPQWNALHRQLVMPEPEGPAAEWEGWGTALKPAREDWILVRKPLSEKSVAANVLRWGTGAINIDGCRVECAGESPSQKRREYASSKQGQAGFVNRTSPERFAEQRAGESLGRWPANLVLDEQAATLLDAQSGTLRSGDRAAGDYEAMGYHGNGRRPQVAVAGDAGGASRFYYVAKPSRKEKESGCEGLPRKGAAELTGRKDGSAGLVMQHDDGSAKANPYAGTSGSEPRANHHPTVKPVALMRYLVRLITPPGGVVLDPFMGSGTTGVAVREEGFSFVGIEKDPDYYAIAEARIGGAPPPPPEEEYVPTPHDYEEAIDLVATPPPPPPDDCYEEVPPPPPEDDEAPPPPPPDEDYDPRSEFSAEEMEAGRGW